MMKGEWRENCGLDRLVLSDLVLRHVVDACFLVSTVFYSSTNHSIQTFWDEGSSNSQEVLEFPAHNDFEEIFCLFITFISLVP